MMPFRTILMMSLIYVAYCKESGERHLTIFTQSIGSMLVSEIGDKVTYLVIKIDIFLGSYPLYEIQ